jgi:hypothetical protein
MLQICVPGEEAWDEKEEEFVTGPDTIISLEHSLISISKWESKWHKPFLGKDYPKGDELMDYIKCMTINKNVDPNVYNLFGRDQFKMVEDYINEPMTATRISNRRGARASREIVTSEVIYYWMTANGIPFECEKWHLNRLLTLIRVCGEKNGPAQKMSQRENMQQMHALNAARKAKLHTRG